MTMKHFLLLAVLTLLGIAETRATDVIYGNCH